MISTFVLFFVLVYKDNTGAHFAYNHAADIEGTATRVVTIHKRNRSAGPRFVAIIRRQTTRGAAGLQPGYCQCRRQIMRRAGCDVAYPQCTRSSQTLCVRSVIHEPQSVSSVTLFHAFFS